MRVPLLVVTPWFSLGGRGTPLEAAVARSALAAARTGADVTVVHLVLPGSTTDAYAPPPDCTMTLRRIIVDSHRVDDVDQGIGRCAGDLLACPVIVHAHSGLPVGAALTRLLPDGAQLVVGEHLASLAPLLNSAQGVGADGALSEHGDVDDASGVNAGYAPVLARCRSVVVPTEALAREFARCFGRNGARLPPVDVVPYVLPSPVRRPPLRVEEQGLPLSRWLLSGTTRRTPPSARSPPTPSPGRRAL